MNIEQHELMQKQAEIFTLDGLEEHISRIQKPFLDALETITDSTRFQADGARDMRESDPHELGCEYTADSIVFTGRGLCEFSCLALYDGLLQKIDKNIHLSLQHANIYFFDKYIYASLNGFSRIVYDGHVILEVLDTQHSKVRYIDPTYGQVDISWAGKMLVSNEETVGNYYKTAGSFDGYCSHIQLPLQKSDLVDTTSYHDTDLFGLLDQKGVTEKNYQMLVAQV